MQTFDIVVTTIFEPAWLEGYLENIRAHGHQDAVTIRVICDRKTPSAVYEAARDAAHQGFAVDCPDLDEQTQYLDSLGLAEEFIPWNTDNRRNIGYMRAWQHGADVLISIDDDNYCRPDSDFIAEHSVVGEPCNAVGAMLATGSPWFNLCQLLQADSKETIYPRGFPYSARNGCSAQLDPMPVDIGEMTIGVNAGLWLDDPDVDAISRLSLRPTVNAANGTDVVLGPDTWSPINSQNTAIRRDAIPAYYYVRMGFPLQGMRIDRFGDIWSGYFLQRCAQHLGEAVRIGSPVADHRRWRHNLFEDLYHELAGIVLTEELLPWLREVPVSGSTYGEAYAELSDALLQEADRFKGFIWDEGGRAFLAETANHMVTWLRALRVLSGE